MSDASSKPYMMRLEDPLTCYVRPLFGIIDNKLHELSEQFADGSPERYSEYMALYERFYNLERDWTHSNESVIRLEFLLEHLQDFVQLFDEVEALVSSTLGGTMRVTDFSLMYGSDGDRTEPRSTFDPWRLDVKRMTESHVVLQRHFERLTYADILLSQSVQATQLLGPLAFLRDEYFLTSRRELLAEYLTLAEEVQRSTEYSAYVYQLIDSVGHDLPVEYAEEVERLSTELEVFSLLETAEVVAEL
jgi:hypothetical protein